MRGYVRRLLGDSYEVQEVTNGAEALAAISRNPPDLVMTDVMMPELDGVGLLRELRASESTRTIPVILLSAKAGEDARIEGMQAGADDYIVKPFTARELLARVGAHLALGKLRGEAAERERALRTELEVRVQERTAKLEVLNRELRQLSSHLQRMQDAERRRIARELHDSVGQLLVAIGMNIAIVETESDKLSEETGKRVEEIAALVAQVSTEIRTISHLLHPPLLDEIGLPSALRWYVDGFAERSNISATLEIPAKLARLPADGEIAIFRAVQECLSNVHRHSGSHSCSVRVVEKDNQVHVEIADDGQGIPQKKQVDLKSSGGGVGLRGLRERLHQLGGTLEIKSSELGTVVTLTLPLANAKHTEGAA
jgi:signal transduction histidine kinase